MVKRKTGTTNGNELEQAFRRLNQEVRDGLQHGFFQITVRCELGTGRRRELTLEAGKNYRFVIDADLLDSSPISSPPK